MSYTIVKKIPEAEEIIQSIPLSIEGHQGILRDRKEVNQILEGSDKRLLLIIGPCSAWPEPAVLEYARRLAQINKKFSDILKIVMRVYIQKPRTTKGWTGPVNQPNPFAKPDIEAGMRYTRKMMIDVIEMGLPIADEALFTHNGKGFQELLTWIAVGARSSEDQEHRIFASALNCAVGMKNPTHGELSIAVNSLIAAQHPHTAVMNGYEIETHGNHHAHVVLRGSNHAPNFSVSHLQEVRKHMDDNKVRNPSIVIDTSHDNCLANGKKNPGLQSNNIFDVLESIKDKPELKQLVKGFMVESFLKPGNQKVDENNPEKTDLSGLSITDPCLGWEETEELFVRLRKILN